MKGRINRSLKYNRERRKEPWVQKTKIAAHKEIARNVKGMWERTVLSAGYERKGTVHSRNFWRRYWRETTSTELLRE